MTIATADTPAIAGGKPIKSTPYTKLPRYGEEELKELREAAPATREEEFGDLLFVLGRLASWLDVDAETALRAANAKFRRRFARVEELADGRPLQQMTPAELDELWNRAKVEGVRP